jgi:hypothetical protein
VPVGRIADVSVPFCRMVADEQSMTWVAEVLCNFSVLPLTPPNIEVLDSRELGP